MSPSRALEPAHIEAGHCAHVLWVCGVAFLEMCSEPAADASRIVEVLRLGEAGVSLQ